MFFTGCRPTTARAYRCSLYAFTVPAFHHQETTSAHKAYLMNRKFRCSREDLVGKSFVWWRSEREPEGKVMTGKDSFRVIVGKALTAGCLKTRPDRQIIKTVGLKFSNVCPDNRQTTPWHGLNVGVFLCHLAASCRAMTDLHPGAFGLPAVCGPCYPRSELVNSGIPVLPPSSALRWLAARLSTRAKGSAPPESNAPIRRLRLTAPSAAP